MHSRRSGRTSLPVFSRTESTPDVTGQMMHPGDGQPLHDQQPKPLQLTTDKKESQARRQSSPTAGFWSHTSFVTDDFPDDSTASRKKSTKSRKIPWIWSKKRFGGGSLSSGDRGSTVSSSSSSAVKDPFQMRMPVGTTVEIDDWSLCWQIDAVGRMPGQLRSPKGVCILRNSGSVVVADSKNARLQIFNGSSGKLVSILGAESDDQRVATTFRNVSRRRMEPRGLCEVLNRPLLVATDLNRVLFIDVEAKHGGLAGNVFIQGKTQLSGVAVTTDSKLILTELDNINPSVGLYENGGNLIKEFKGDFRLPEFVSWNQDRNIAAISDGGQQSILLYDASGKLQKTFGQVRAGTRKTSAPGSVTRAPIGYPAGISWWDSNRLLVADRSEHRVVVVDIRNFSMQDALTADSVEKRVKYPVCVAANGINQLVITEEFYDVGVNENRMKMFQLPDSDHQREFELHI